MARLLRGEIRWANLNPAMRHEQSGIRPVLILSEDVFNRHSGMVIAVALTSQEPKAGFPLTLELENLDLPKRFWVKISQVRTLSIKRIGDKFAQVEESVMARIVEGLNEIMGY